MLYFESFGSLGDTVYSDSTTETSIRISSLEPFTDYTFRVAAVTVAEGPFAEVNATTDESGMCYIRMHIHVRIYVHE